MVGPVGPDAIVNADCELDRAFPPVRRPFALDDTDCDFSSRMLPVLIMFPRLFLVPARDCVVVVDVFSPSVEGGGFREVWVPFAAA